MDILIKDATIVNSESSEKSDVLISGGKIADVRPGIEAKHGIKIIDATGKFILPGAVDPHVHMQLPTPAGPSSDDFSTGSVAALHGGTTTLIDFVTPHRGQPLTEALDLRIAEAKASLCDCYFHVSPVEWRDTTEDEIAECVKRGIKSFKVYLAYKNSVGLNDNDFLKVLKAVAKHNAIVTVHCESGDEIEILRNDYAKKGNTSPLYHAMSRPASLEAEAVKNAIDLAKVADCPLYIVHVSSELSLKYIAEAKKSGQRVYAETCPQYLLLDDSLYKGNFDETVKYVISPPLRKKADNEALWDAIKSGLIDTVGTDHCPFNLSQKSVGVNDFRLIPNGAGGVEHRLALMYTYGVKSNRISINRMVEVVSAAPAKNFGLYPQKGTVSEGSDADLVIWNPVPENTIKTESHIMKCDLDIYDGIKTSGRAECVIKDGRVVDGKSWYNGNVTVQK